MYLLETLNNYIIGTIMEATTEFVLDEMIVQNSK